MNYVRETCGCCGELVYKYTTINGLTCLVLIGCTILNLQTARNAVEPWILSLLLIALSRWVSPTSPWKRTSSSTPLIDWDLLPTTRNPNQVHVSKCNSKCSKKACQFSHSNKKSLLLSQVQGLVLCSTATMGPSNQSVSTTKKSTH